MRDEGDWAVPSCGPGSGCELNGMVPSCGEVLGRCSPSEGEIYFSAEEMSRMNALILRHVLGNSCNGPCLHYILRGRVLDGDLAPAR